ncbi:hypothetical protein G4V62_14605 [Bacillaceae bacterium SIJ1]|uniref:hypothetical protein n=1 Tax=Litoribacterium kuwaitense TaxID=1398745 RepID=UPI0013ED2511|nr:hypothetical protein [Litoribacterium kuwaitense]NGP46120.1 hypothetical protein [Litoribacterium kuwaitense]
MTRIEHQFMSGRARRATTDECVSQQAEAAFLQRCPNLFRIEKPNDKEINDLYD